MDDPSKPPPLDYPNLPEEHRTAKVGDYLRFIVYFVLGLIVSLAVAVAAAIFLMPRFGGSGH